MKDRTNTLLIYVAIFVGALLIGGNVIGWAFTGLITLFSFIFLCESVPILKWFVARTTQLLDVGMFCFAIYSKVHFGVSVTMSLLFATIGFTLLYAPYVRATYKSK